ncbi:hypothetical protein QCA50_000986 [Cerrena zonata]|uniref:Uncharacterized protein n=1 Tax=Cerrena zonata TaxID=2478898 RepID=A0AAW0GVU0_9APHY
MLPGHVVTESQVQVKKRKGKRKEKVYTLGVRSRSPSTDTTIITPTGLALPNPWCTKANGCRVHSLPMWLYCDDTLGNSSKKWNKHNSFLFVLAGLPCEQVHLAYNIHFVSTSNIAPPLEMAEGIVDNFKWLQQDGLIAWDCEFKEEVVYIPWGFSWLGNNLMQSELCSHIGLQGKYFCCICHVRGKDSNQTASFDGEMEQLKDFLMISEPHTCVEMLNALNEQWDHVCAGAPSRVDTVAMQSGVKDKHFMTFVERFSELISKLKKQNWEYGQTALDGLNDMLQDVLNGLDLSALFNPILYMNGKPLIAAIGNIITKLTACLELNSHADTPVEILYVILLGFVKYFWQDAVSRQGAKGCKILKACLSSLPVHELNISPIDSHILVQYAKSLTGCDFCIIVQVAPAVLLDLIPVESYEAWLALC